MENSNFLKEKYWGKKEFQEAVGKSRLRWKSGKKPFAGSGEEIRQAKQEGALKLANPKSIPKYLNRLESIIERRDPKTGRRGHLFLEKSIYPKYIIKPENISDEYIKNILLGNFAERQGYQQTDLKNPELKERILSQFEESTNQDLDNFEIPDKERKEVKEMVITDQKSRLDSWFDYFTSPESKNIPFTFRYWAFAEMLKLGDYDPIKKTFNPRTATTVASFPELDQQALSLVFDKIQKKCQKQTQEPPPPTDAEDPHQQTEFKKILELENFGRIYSFELNYVNSLRLPTEHLANTNGEWRKFSKGSSAEKLIKSLQGFNTKWCIAGKGHAQNYLSHSDIWIRFSQDVDDKNSIPRACIVDSKEHGITEVRGILFSETAKQHLDDYITPVVSKKLQELPGGEKWQKTMESMKLLAEIHLLHLKGELDQLNNDQDEDREKLKKYLKFIYEIDQPITMTGYNQDPRIQEIRSQRNPEEDMLIIFDCTKKQIAKNPKDIDSQTKAYCGPLKAEVFGFIQEYNIEHFYTSFPEGKIQKGHFEIGGIPKLELIREIKNKQYKINDNSQYMMNSDEFSVLENPERLDIVRLKIKDLFDDKKNHTTAEIFDQAQKLGLELCPAEAGPHLRMKYQEVFHREQPMNEWLRIAMKLIPDRDGDPLVFHLACFEDGLWLDSGWAFPTSKWDPDDGFVFRLRKVSHEF